MVIFLTESNNSNLFSFWHGGQLNNEVLYSDHTQKRGRYEYGVGLYLISSYDIAKKYAKGSRTLYKVYVKKGNSLNKAFLNSNDCIEFIKNNVKKNKQKDIITRIIDRYPEKINGNIFNNIMVNYELITPSNQNEIKDFYISNKVDYLIVDNAFGNSSTMIVIFNNKIIDHYERIEPKNKINVFDLSEENDYSLL